MKPRSLPAPSRLVPLLALLAAGCAGVPQRTVGLASLDDPAVTSTQLQLRVYETGRRLSSAIEAAADSIAGLAAEPEVRRRALLWKISATPLVEEASLRNEPLVAVVDLWAFTEQQAAYFEDGDGRDAFGPLQRVAADAAREMALDARRTAARTVTSGEISPASVRALNAWVSDHPIRGVEMRRESLLASDWSVLGLHEATLFGTVASVDRSLLGVSHRLGYINEGLLKQVRWSAELLGEEALAAPRVDSMLSALTTTTAAMGELLAGAPAMLERAREAVLRDLSERKREEMAALDRQRLETLDALDRQRTATLAALARERAAALEALRSERIATLASADSIAQRMIDRIDEAATRMLRWVLITVAFVGTVAVVGTVSVVRTLKSDSRV